MDCKMDRMKKHLLPILAGCAALVPLIPSQADGQTFGGFAPGKIFRLTVTERSSVRTRWFDTKENVPVPDGIPDFQEGQTVRFKIGLRGQLKGPGFAIRYRRSENRVNFYSNNPTVSSPQGDAARVSKTRSKEPKSATLIFYKLRFSGIVPITNSVRYELE